MNLSPAESEATIDVSDRFERKIISSYNTVQVRWEDQQKINEFGRLNSGLPELREEIAEFKASFQALQ